MNKLLGLGLESWRMHDAWKYRGQQHLYCYTSQHLYPFFLFTEMPFGCNRRFLSPFISSFSSHGWYWQPTLLRGARDSVDVYMYACMYVCRLYVYIYIIYVCMHACMNLWMYVCMCACIYDCMSVWTCVCIYMHTCRCMYPCSLGVALFHYTS